MISYMQFFREIPNRTLAVTDIYKEKNVADILNILVSYIHKSIRNACMGGVDETRDFGGDIFKGGTTYDTYSVKRYMREILDDCFSYLQDDSGVIHYDMPHILVASSVLQYERGRLADSTKVLSAGLLLNAESIAQKMSAVLKTKGKKINIGFNYSTYQARKYMMYFTIPRGYNCYLFEPHNIAQIALLTQFGMNADSIANVVDSGKQGLLISGIPQSIETLVYDTLFRNQIVRLNGYFANQFRTMYNRAIQNKSIGTGGFSAPYFYFEHILPTMCSLMDTHFFQPYIHDISQHLDLTEQDCFINYITPSRVSLCLRSDLDINYVLPSVSKMMVRVNPRMDFTNVMNYI